MDLDLDLVSVDFEEDFLCFRLVRLGLDNFAGTTFSK
jgi:O-methyltransferase involved in polyketide biosynthesis